MTIGALITKLPGDRPAVLHLRINLLTSASLAARVAKDTETSSSRRFAAGSGLGAEIVVGYSNRRSSGQRDARARRDAFMAFLVVAGSDDFTAPAIPIIPSFAALMFVIAGIGR